MRCYWNIVKSDLLLLKSLALIFGIAAIGLAAPMLAYTQNASSTIGNSVGVKPPVITRSGATDINGGDMDPHYHLESFDVYDANPTLLPGIDLGKKYITRKEAIDLRSRLTNPVFANKLRRNAAVADGATQLLVVARITATNLDFAFIAPSMELYWKDRYLTPQNQIPGTEIPETKLQGMIDHDTLGQLPGLVSPHKFDDGDYYFAIVTVPPQLHAGDYAQDLSVRMKIHYEWIGGDRPTQEKPTDRREGTGNIFNYSWDSPTIQLKRPPVLLVHGLWSSGSTWLSMRWFVEENFIETFIADYKPENARSFETNKAVLWRNDWDDIQEILDRYRQRGTAITRLDVVGHSMGGILTRKFLATQVAQPNRKNFNKGYVRRFITIDTPHYGTPIANLLINMAQQPPNGGFFALHTRLFGIPIDQGAVSDLRAGSSAIANLPGTNIRSFAIIGTAETEQAKYYSGPRAAFFEYTDLHMNIPGIDGTSLSSFYESIFPDVNDPADAIVPFSSQRGGLTSPNFHRFTEVLHGPAINDTFIQQKVVRLLTGPETDFSDGFPSNSLASQSTAKKGKDPVTEQAPVAARSTDPSFTITSPTEGQIVAPGSVVNVSVSPNSGSSISSMLAACGDLGDGAPIEYVDSSPFTTSLTVPSNFAGDLPVHVLVGDGKGRTSVQTVNITVVPTATLLSIATRHNSYALSGLRSKNTIGVEGLYDDGIVRNLSSATTGTSYSSNSPQIASVDSNGLVEAVSADRRLFMSSMLDTVLISLSKWLFRFRM